MSAGARVPASSFDHPAFSVIDPTVRARVLALEHFPAPQELRGLARGLPNAITPWFDFAEQDRLALLSAGGFDRQLAQTKAIPTRLLSFHDLLGALIWLHFPALKTAIHQAQLSGEPSARGPRENAATHLDESGVLVLSSDPSFFEALAALEWVEVFWERRAELQQTTRFLVFGHGLLDALREPHPRLMGMALFVRVAQERLTLPASELRVLVDGGLARVLPDFLSAPDLLAPLPVLGVPGWSAKQSRAYYEDQRYFRKVRQRPRPARAARWLVLD